MPEQQKQNFSLENSQKIPIQYVKHELSAIQKACKIIDKKPYDAEQVLVDNKNLYSYKRELEKKMPKYSSLQ